MLVNKLKTSILSSGIAAVTFSLGVCIALSVFAFNSNIEASDTSIADNNQLVVKNMPSDWVRPSDQELQKKLTKLQFDVTRKGRHRTPFSK